MTAETWSKDGKNPYLFIKETPHGKAWYFRRFDKTTNKPIKRKIGNYTELSATAARIKAEGLMTALSAGTLVTRATKPTTIPTLREITNLYEGYLRAQKRKDPAYVSRSVDAAWGDLMHRTLDTITTAELAKEHNIIAVTRGRVAAGRAVKYLRTLYRYADDQDMYSGRNPAKSIKVTNATPRKVFLTEKDIVVLRKVLDEFGGDKKDYMLLALLTALRRSNLSGLRWDWLDLEAATVTIPAQSSKNGEEMVIPLVPEAVAILKARQSNGSEYVFPSPRASGGVLVDPYRWLVQVRNRMGELGRNSEFTIHDLRRSAATRLVVKGAPLPVIAAMLGHSDLSSVQIYARTNTEMVREWMEK